VIVERTSWAACLRALRELGYSHVTYGPGDNPIVQSIARVLRPAEQNEDLRIRLGLPPSTIYSLDEAGGVVDLEKKSVVARGFRDEP